MTLLNVLKHLPGKHNQKLHGKYGLLSEFATTPTLKKLVTGESKYTGLGDRRILENVIKELGYNGKPEVVNTIASSKPLYRGVSGDEASAYVQQFKTGDYFVGEGVYGGGTYTSTDKAIALDYADKSAANLLTMALKPDAKIIEYKDLQRKLSDLDTAVSARADAVTQKAWKVIDKDRDKAKQYLAKAESMRMSTNNLYKAMMQNPSIAAAALGYDAITHSYYNYAIVLNKSKVQVER